MKLMVKSSLVCVLVLLFAGVIIAEPKEVVEKSAQITSQCKIYEEMNPQSTTLIRAYKGEAFNIIEARNAWLKVETIKGNGWLNRANCRTYATEKSELNNKPKKLFIFIIGLIIALIGGIVFFVRQQNQEDSYI